MGQGNRNFWKLSSLAFFPGRAFLCCIPAPLCWESGGCAESGREERSQRSLGKSIPEENQVPRPSTNYRGVLFVHALLLKCKCSPGRLGVTEKRMTSISGNSHTKTSKSASESAAPSQEEEAALALAPGLIWVCGNQCDLKKCRTVRGSEGTRGQVCESHPCPTRKPHGPQLPPSLALLATRHFLDLSWLPLAPPSCFL